jgi:hypothetical protein
MASTNNNNNNKKPLSERCYYYSFHFYTTLLKYLGPESRQSPSTQQHRPPSTAARMANNPTTTRKESSQCHYIACSRKIIIIIKNNINNKCKTDSAAEYRRIKSAACPCNLHVLPHHRPNLRSFPLPLSHPRSSVCVCCTLLHLLSARVLCFTVSAWSWRSRCTGASCCMRYV